MQDVGSNHFYLWRSGALLREVTGVSGSYLGVYQLDACERGTFQAENIMSNDTEMRTLVHRRSRGLQTLQRSRSITRRGGTVRSG